MAGGLARAKWQRCCARLNEWLEALTLDTLGFFALAGRPVGGFEVDAEAGGERLLDGSDDLGGGESVAGGLIEAEGGVVQARTEGLAAVIVEV